MVKQPFAYVQLHVDRLYDRKIDQNNNEEINEQCEFIAEFIKLSGWTEENYFNTVMGELPVDNESN